MAGAFQCGIHARPPRLVAHGLRQTPFGGVHRDGRADLPRRRQPLLVAAISILNEIGWEEDDDRDHYELTTPRDLLGVVLADIRGCFAGEDGFKRELAQLDAVVAAVSS